MTWRALRGSTFGILTLLCLASAAGAQGRPEVRWMRGGHTYYMTQLVYASDGLFFASAAQDNTVKIWRASDSLLLRTLVVEGGSFALALSPDNGTLCADGHFPDKRPFVACWRVSDGALLWKSLIPGSVPNESAGSLAFAPDGQRLASVSNFSFSIWRVSDGVEINDFRGASPGYGFGGVVYSPDGQFLATNTGESSRLVFLNPSTGSVTWDSGFVGSGFGADIDFSPDSQLVAIVNGTGMRVFGAVDHVQRPFPLGTSALNVAFSPSGARLASGGHSSVNLWNASTAALVRTWDGHGSVGAGFGALPVAFSGDSTKLISGVFDIKRWNASNGTFDALLTGQVGPVRLLAISANEQVVATASTASGAIADHVISLFRASDGALLRYIDYGTQPLRGLAVSPDGKHVAAADTSGLRTWSVSTGTLEKSHPDPGGFSGYRPMVYTPSGTAIAESGDAMGSVWLWTLGTDTLTPVVAGPATDLRFLPDSRLVIGHGNVVKIVTLAGALVRQMSDSSNINALAVSPDGSMIAAAGTDGAFSPFYVGRLWRVSDGAPLQTFVGHTSAVLGIGFSWDNRSVMTGSQDSTVRIWRVSDGSQSHVYNQETYLAQGTVIDGVRSLVASTQSAGFVYGRGDATIVMAENPDAAPVLLSMKVPALVTGCKPGSATVTLDRPAPPAGVTVVLGSSAATASVPGTITIKKGATKKSFKITTVPVAALETATVTATLGGDSLHGDVGVRPIGVAALTVVPTTLVGGSAASGSLSLECAAGPGDVLVTLTSTIPSAAQATVAALTIPAGTKDGVFDVATSPVTATKKPKIAAATSPDALKKSKTLTVTP